MYLENTFTQKKFSHITEFLIEETGLLIKEKSRRGETESHHPFEQIKTNKAMVLDQNKGLLTVACIFAGIALITFIASFSDTTIEATTILIWLIISLILFTIYFTTRKSKLYILVLDKKPVEIVPGKDHINEAIEFVDKLLITRNTYLVSKYGNLNRNLRYEVQLDNLNWLLNNRAITKTDYDTKILELNCLFSPHSSSKPIGFSNSN